MARLIHLNGPPAIGKSTLAARYADEHPGTLNLDIDRLLPLVGGWTEPANDTHLLLRPAARAMARAQLAGGHDVVLPQYLARLGRNRGVRGLGSIGRGRLSRDRPAGGRRRVRRALHRPTGRDHVGPPQQDDRRRAGRRRLPARDARQPARDPASASGRRRADPRHGRSGRDLPSFAQPTRRSLSRPEVRGRKKGRLRRGGPAFLMSSQLFIEMWTWSMWFAVALPRFSILRHVGLPGVQMRCSKMMWLMFNALA